jgi:hypothetical protein
MGDSVKVEIRVNPLSTMVEAIPLSFDISFSKQFLSRAQVVLMACVELTTEQGGTEDSKHE